MSRSAPSSVHRPRIVLALSGGLDIVLGLLMGGVLLLFALAVWSDISRAADGWLLKYVLTFGGLALLPLSLCVGGGLRAVASFILRDGAALRRAARIGMVSLVPGAALGPIVLGGVCAFGGRAVLVLLVLTAYWLVMGIPAFAAVVFTWTRSRVHAPAEPGARSADPTGHRGR